MKKYLISIMVMLLAVFVTSNVYATRYEVEDPSITTVEFGTYDCADNGSVFIGWSCGNNWWESNDRWNLYEDNGWEYKYVAKYDKNMWVGENWLTSGGGALVGSGAEDCPILTSTVTGLIPNAVYDLVVKGPVEKWEVLLIKLVTEGETDFVYSTPEKNEWRDGPRVVSDVGLIDVGPVTATADGKFIMEVDDLAGLNYSRFDYFELTLNESWVKANLCPPCPTIADAISQVGATADAVCPQGGSYRNHGAYVSCVSTAVESALTMLPKDCFTAEQLEEISSAVVSARARSEVGK